MNGHCDICSTAAALLHICSNCERDYCTDCSGSATTCEECDGATDDEFVRADVTAGAAISPTASDPEPPVAQSTAVQRMLRCPVVGCCGYRGRTTITCMACQAYVPGDVIDRAVELSGAGNTSSPEYRSAVAAVVSAAQQGYDQQHRG